MGQWFGKGHRGLVFGLWSSCVSTGNILGGLLASVTLHFGWGWQSVFLLPGALMVLWAIMCVAWMSPSPEAAGLAPSESDSTGVATGATALLLADAVADNDDNDQQGPGVELHTLRDSDALGVLDDDDDNAGGGRVLPEQPGGFLSNFARACCIPGVAIYAITNAFTKLVSYSLLFWLPYYLTVGLGQSEESADLVATLFDVGGVIGGVLLGALSDWALRRGAGRSLTIMPILLLSAVTLLLYSWWSDVSLTVNVLLLTLMGTFSNSAYNLINSAVAADLGSSVKGNAQLVSTGARHAMIGSPHIPFFSLSLLVSGVIDGSGSIGASTGQLAVALLESRGWSAVFGFLIASSLVSMLALSFLALRDCRALRVHRRRGRVPREQEAADAGDATAVVS